MESDLDNASGFSYKSELGYLRLAVLEQEEAHKQIWQEIENFKPLTRDQLIEKIRFQYRQAPDQKAIQVFVERQADAYASDPNLQMVTQLGERYAVRRTLSVIAIHALCEGLINAALVIGLHHVGKSKLFQTLEMCSLVEKWEICPLVFAPKHRLERSSHLFWDLKVLCKYRNSSTHQKIELRERNGNIVSKGNASSIHIDKKSRDEIGRLFSLPRNLNSHLVANLEDDTLKFYIESILR